MRKLLPALAALCLIFQEKVFSIEEWFQNPSLEFSAGYRLDSLKWTIAGVHNYPDVLSELNWKNLQMYQVDLLGQFYICDEFVVRIEGDYGQILDGKVQDSDFEKNHRRGEYSRFICDADKGEAFDLSASIGYFFPLFCDEFFITPLIGYTYSEQHLRMSHGDVKIYDSKRVHIDVPDLHSNYRTKWRGPWIGFEANYMYDCQWDFFAGVEFHWVKYNGTGHWNLRPEFYDDFQHRAHGHGVKSYLGAEYCVCGAWSTGIKLSYLDFQTNHGVDRTFLLEDILDSQDSLIGHEKVVSETRLNEVHWRSFRVEANLTYAF